MTEFVYALVLVFVGLVLGYLVGRADRDRERADELLDVLERIYEQRERRP